jgi:hypothetical protein
MNTGHGMQSGPPLLAGEIALKLGQLLAHRRSIIPPFLCSSYFAARSRQAAWEAQVDLGFRIANASQPDVASAGGLGSIRG